MGAAVVPVHVWTVLVRTVMIRAVMVGAEVVQRTVAAVAAAKQVT